MMKLHFPHTIAWIWRRFLLVAFLISVLLVACTPIAEPSPTPTLAPRIVFVTPTPEQSATATAIATEAAPAATQVVATPTLVSNNLTGDGLMVYLRESPNMLGTIIAIVSPFSDIQAIGRSSDRQWVEIQFASDISGWVIRGSIPTNFNIEALPITGETRNTNADVIILPPTIEQNLVLYQLPNDTQLLELGSLSALRIDGRLADSNWTLVTTNSGFQGWIETTTIPVALPENIPIVNLPSLSSSGGTGSSSPVQSTGADAYVKSNAGGLRLRQLPTTDSAVLLNMNAQAALNILGKNTDSSWVLIEMPEGYQGWTAVAYLDVNINLNTIDAIENPQPVPLIDLPTPVGAPQVASVGGGGARQIYLRGQQMGNRRNVFSTVGDSLTDTANFLRHIAYGYNLRDYGYLLPTLQFFNSDTGQGNAYNRRAISSNAGWSSFSVLDVNNSPSICEAGELPIQCEYRLVKPAISLIMIGTNDAPAFSPEQYRANLLQMIEISSQNGVIPVLSTLPPRAEFNTKIIAYNNVIRQLASSYDVPLWDLYNAVAPLPNSGYASDGVHLSSPPGAPATTMDFTAENLQYGTTMRNLTALQTLKAVLENVMY